MTVRRANSRFEGEDVWVGNASLMSIPDETQSVKYVTYSSSHIISKGQVTYQGRGADSVLRVPTRFCALRRLRTLRSWGSWPEDGPPLRGGPSSGSSRPTRSAI